MGIKWKVDVMEGGSGVVTLSNEDGGLIAQKAFEDIAKCGSWIKDITAKLKESKYKIRPIGRL